MGAIYFCSFSVGFAGLLYAFVTALLERHHRRPRLSQGLEGCNWFQQLSLYRNLLTGRFEGGKEWSVYRHHYQDCQT